MADSGFERQQRFLKSARNYYLVYEDYVREKIGRVIPWCDSLRVRAFRTSVKLGSETFVVRSPRPEEYEGDMSDFPHFSEPKWSMTDSLRASLVNLFILFLWNALLFMAAHYVIAKRDLR